MLDTMKVIKANGLFPNKALGQNFLIDRDMILNIARSVEPEGISVLEIGAGLGALTFELAERAQRLVAFEIDGRLFNILSDSLSGRPGVELIQADFLKYPTQKLLELFEGKSFYVAANLPYYITTPICLRLIESALPICGMTLMMQEEAADRFFAKPSDKNYGPLSVLSQLYYDVDRRLRLGPDAYYPRPEVNSVVLGFRRNAYAHVAGLPRIVHAAFAMRRKTLYNNLSVLFGKEGAQALIARSGIAPNVRAEKLLPEDFIKLAKYASEYENQTSLPPSS